MSESYHPENYWDNVAGEIASREDLTIIAGDDEPYYRYKRKRFLELFRTLDFSGKSVLEVGSGPGGNLEVVHAMGARMVAGADISSQMISVARHNLADKNIQLVKINGRELPFPGESFDIVFTSTVLQHNTNEETLRALVAEICRVSSMEVFLFERVETTIKGHETNLGRPVSYYASLMQQHGFGLVEQKSLQLQASYYVCGAIRKLFNPRSRKEGEKPTTVSILLQQLTLPFTKLLDHVIPSHRDVTFMRFKKGA
jgi:ubiquinone/menaquinone biosynthesis C-methylase UbiE